MTPESVVILRHAAGGPKNLPSVGMVEASRRFGEIVRRDASGAAPQDDRLSTAHATVKA
jgi:hypothetical protein